MLGSGHLYEQKIECLYNNNNDDNNNNKSNKEENIKGDNNNSIFIIITIRIMITFRFLAYHGRWTNSAFKHLS